MTEIQAERVILILCYIWLSTTGKEDHTKRVLVFVFLLCSIFRLATLLIDVVMKG